MLQLKEISNKEAILGSNGEIEKLSNTLYLYETIINNKTYIIRVDYCEWCDNPRDWSNATYLYLSHRKYNFPKEGNLYIDEYEDINEQIEKYEKQGYWILPVYAYEHGGITISLGSFCDSWDSGLLGWVYCDEKLRKQENIETEEQFYDLAKNEIKMYDKYLQGDCYDVYGYCVEDKEELEPLHGYYPVEDYNYEECIKEFFSYNSINI